MSAYLKIHIDGAVQGVGFRPTVFRTASRMGLHGAVTNSLDGVDIYLAGADATIASRLMETVRQELPPAARIDSVEVAPCAKLPDGATDLTFTILQSSTDGRRATDVSPDIAICSDCLDDIRRHRRRTGYPLTNCTNCGPRFSIIEALPYDRPLTTMRSFEMCADCAREYADPLDRRFHAQPVCCTACGPRYNVDAPERVCASLLAAGDLIIVKGLGGYNILCDARRADAVARLRALKHRPRKPFAVMMPSVEVARRYVALSPSEEECLTGWRAPIVIANAATDGYRLPDEVAPGCHTLGVMLPYMGLHHMTAWLLPDMPVVVTSANRPSCPIIIDDAEAEAYGREMGITVVGFDRRIAKRQDDSVVRLAAGRPLIYRRSRGFVPEPVWVDANVDGIIGMGADVTSAWAFGRGSDIIQSQYIGSLLGGEGEDALRQSLAHLSQLFRIKGAATVVVDAHPAYASARIGREWADIHGARVREMYHHHAHAVSVMADYGITDPTLALVLDGTGYGPDGSIWGSELLYCTPLSFESLAHGQPLAMPGGDAASREPWRMAVSALIAVDGDLRRLPQPLRTAVGNDAVEMAAVMTKRGLRAPMSRGAGRLWDAAAALLGVAYTNGYEAEAPILLEQLARSAWPAEPYPSASITTVGLLGGVVADVASAVDPAIIAARFHATFASAWADQIIAHASRLGLKQVVASGGVMQNALLVEALDSRLSEAGISLLLPRRTPVNDACIAVGQVFAAAYAEQHSDQE